jgi:hypothetical protein
MPEERKEKFRDQFKDWVERTTDRRLEALSQTDASRLMSRFFVEEVIGPLMPGIVPEDDIELQNSIIDGPNDSGVDFIYRSDGHVLIVQAKLRGRDRDEEAEAVGRFLDAPQRLHQAVTSKGHKLSAQLRELVSEIDWETDGFHMFFVTTGKVTRPVQDRLDQGAISPDGIGDFEERLDLQLLDESGLNQYWREARSAGDFPKATVPIQFVGDEDDRPWCHFTDSKKRSLYVGEVSGAVLNQLYSQHRASLFTMNIRDYVGDTSTNKSIIATALRDPSNFIFFNNGVTAIASKITEDEDRNILNCERLSVINGAQTVRSLRRAATQRKQGQGDQSLRDVRVLLRIVTFDFPREIQFVQDTTRFNNTQNSVKVADFRSNDAVQKDLATRFYSLYRGGKRFAYKNKRSPSRGGELSISLEDFAKTLHAFDHGPDDVAGGTRYLFDTSAKTGGYRKVFGDPDHPLTDPDFKAMAGTYFLCEQVKEIWEAERAGLKKRKEPLRPALERKWLVYYVVGALLRALYGKLGADLTADIRCLYKPNQWMDGANPAVVDLIGRVYSIATDVATQSYEFRAEDEESFRHRNWFRSEQTLQDVEKNIERALKFQTSFEQFRLFPEKGTR